MMQQRINKKQRREHDPFLRNITKKNKTPQGKTKNGIYFTFPGPGPEI